MAEEQSAAQKAVGDFAPKLVEPGHRHRLVALYRTDQLGFHLRRALENGLTKDEHPLPRRGTRGGSPHDCKE